MAAAPTYPTELTGDRAQILMEYLSELFHQSPILREKWQVTGFEMDELWQIASEEWPLISDPDTCPTWALTVWEAVLGLAASTRAADWSTAERRTSIQAHINKAVTETEVIAFLAAEGRCLTTDITISFAPGPSPYWMNIVTDVALSNQQKADIEVAAHHAIPAHFSFLINGAGGRI